MIGSMGVAENYPYILDMGKYGIHPCKSFKDAKRIVRIYIVAPRIFAYPQNYDDPITNDGIISQVLLQGNSVELYPSRFAKKRLLGRVYSSSNGYQIRV